MADILPHRPRAGGASLRIANVLALLGTPALLALVDRSPDPLALVRVYTVAKAGIQGLPHSLARDLGPHRIRVNTVVPSWVMTEREFTR